MRGGVLDVNIFEVSTGGGAARKRTDLKGRYGNPGREVVTDGQYFYFSWLERVSDLWVMDVKTKS